MSLIGTLLVNLKANTSSFDRNIKKSHANFKSMASSMANLATEVALASLKFVGRIIAKIKDIAVSALSFAYQKIKTLVKMTAAAFAGATAYIIKNGATFEKSMSRVQALTNATGKEFEGLRDLAVELGKKTVYTAEDAAEAMSYLALAGIKIKDIMAAMPAVLDMAAAGQLNMAETADMAARIMSGLNIKSENMAATADILAKAFSTANTDLLQLGEALKYVGPVATATGKGIEETVAAIQMLSNAGIQADMAGTSLRGILSDLSGATSMAKKTIKALGVEIEGTTGAMRPLADILDDFNAKTAKMSQVQKIAKIMQIFGERGGPGMAVLLAKGGDALRDFENNLKNAGGTAERISNTQISNLAGRWENLKSVIDSIAISIYNKYSPVLQSFISNIAKWFDQNQGTVVAWADKVIEKIQAAIGTLRDWFSYLTNDTPGAMIAVFDSIMTVSVASMRIMGNVAEVVIKDLMESLRRKAGYKPGLSVVAEQIRQDYYPNDPELLKKSQMAGNVLYLDPKIKEMADERWKSYGLDNGADSQERWRNAYQDSQKIFLQMVQQLQQINANVKKQVNMVGSVQ